MKHCLDVLVDCSVIVSFRRNFLKKNLDVPTGQAFADLAVFEALKKAASKYSFFTRGQRTAIDYLFFAESFFRGGDTNNISIAARALRESLLPKQSFTLKGLKA